MYEYIFYGLAVCAAVMVTGTVAALMVIRKRSMIAKSNSLFGSVVKMPPAQNSIFPISLYKTTEKCKDLSSSANDLSNVEAQQDAGLAGYKAPLPEWTYEVDNNGATTVVGRGVHKWAVHFRMRYDVTLEHLEVGILQTSTIALSNGTSTSFIFFNVYLMPYESEHKQSSLHPYAFTTTTFNETFYFRLKHVDALSTILRLSLYTMDSDRTRTCLGHVAQPLCGLSVFDGQVHYLTRDLGTLEAASMEGCLGEARLSLCYQMQKEKLKLRLLDARNLPPQTATDSKYYLRMDIIIGDRIVKTKRTLTRCSLRDLFDCAYAFVVPCKHMDVCALMFSIIEQLKCSDHLVKERPWGRFTIGPCSYAHGAGVDHWKMMLANSKKIIEMWHVIARAY